MRCYCGCTQWMGPKHALSCAECGRPNEKRKKRFLFPSLSLTSDHIRLADEQGIELVPSGYLDPFCEVLDKQIEALDAHYNLDGIVCFHPLTALVAQHLSFPVAVFGYHNSRSANKLVIWR